MRVIVTFLFGTAVLALSGSLARCGDDDGPATQAPTVVFVCEHGTSKSLVAAALFNRMAEQRGLSIHAISRAVSANTVATTVPPRLVRSISEDGFNLEAFRRQALGSSEATHALRVVVIGYDGNVDAATDAAVERWDDVAPASLEYENAKKTITLHIETLLRTFVPVKPTGSMK